MNVPINLLSRQSLIKLVLLIFILLWTLFLVAETWKIQHSCNPMIAGPNISLPSECKVPDDTDGEGKTGQGNSTPGATNGEGKTGQGNSTPGATNGEGKTGQGGSLLPDPIGAAVGSVALVGLAIVEAPVTVAVGAGIAIWFLVRTAIKAMNGV